MSDITSRPGNPIHADKTIASAILGTKAYGLNNTDARGMVDITAPGVGQNGYQTDFRGYVSNANYVRRNIVAVLIEAPRGFQLLPDSKEWVNTLKSLVEVHAQSIEGLNSTLNVDWAETAVGGAGEMQEDLQNVTRNRSTPTFTWVEKRGMPILSFLNGWVTNLLMDPITKVPGVMSRVGEKPGDLLPDFTGATILFFEPDPTHTRIAKAWLCTNMHPKGSIGELVGSRDLTSGGDTLTYSIEFTALTQVGYAVNLLAQTYLDNLNLTGVNPNNTPAFVSRIEQDVLNGGDGYSNQINRAATESPEPTTGLG